MRNKENIREMLEYFQTSEEKALEFDEKAIVAAYEKNNDHQSLAIKILSIVGGIMASLSFLGFLYITGVYGSKTGLLVFGVLCITVAILVDRVYNKTIMDTVSVSSFLVGFVLLALGFELLEIDRNSISAILIILAFCFLTIVRNYILSFIAVLIINGNILALISFNNGYNMIPVYVSALALMVAYFFLNEAKIITADKVLSKLYSPIQTGLVFSFLAGLLLLGKKEIIPMSRDYIWLSSVTIISVIVYLVSILLDVLSIMKVQHRTRIYIISILLLLPTALSPAISGAILLILLSFIVNYKTGFALGIIAFIYFVAQYYYDLNFTLLTKSILLFSSGVLFMVLYWFIYKNLTTNEKI